MKINLNQQWYFDGLVKAYRDYLSKSDKIDQEKQKEEIKSKIKPISNIGKNLDIYA